MMGESWRGIELKRGVVCLEYGAAPKKAASDRVADARQRGFFHRL
jgi:hypothetical protein